jgi:hypothetical protein
MISSIISGTMSAIQDKIIHPNRDGRYYAQQSQVIHGLWTPYGILTPLFVGVWPDGSLSITYNMNAGAQFMPAQKRKIKYVKKRGIEVIVTRTGTENADE